MSVSPAHFRIACFRHSHHASYFDSREIGSVQKELTRPYTVKTNLSLKSRLSHVYTITLPLFRLRATFTYQHNYPPALAYLCAHCVPRPGPLSPTFCVLGSWDSRDISFITPPFLCFHPYLCALPFWVHCPLIFFLLCLFSDSFGGLATYLLRHRPPIIFPRSWMFLSRALFFLSAFFPFHVCINIDSAHVAWTIASHHTHHFCA